MNCKFRSEFHLEDLISDVGEGLSDEEKNLLRFFRRINKNIILDWIRDTFYSETISRDSGYLDLEARNFWDDIATISEDDDYLGAIKLSPDDKEALYNARKGLIGKDLYLRIMTWAYAHGFIRKDITEWNCRVFRYLDSYLMTKENIVVGIFNRYETIRDIETIHTEVMDFLKKNIPSRIMRIIENAIDTDEKVFEGLIEEVELSDQEKELRKIGNEYLRPLAEDIYKIIFEA